MRLRQYLLRWCLYIMRKESLLPILTMFTFSIEEQKMEVNTTSDPISICDSIQTAFTGFSDTIFINTLSTGQDRDTQSIITDIVTGVKVNTSIAACPSAPCNGVWDGNN